TAFIAGRKFEVDYFTDHVVLIPVLASVTLKLQTTLPSPVKYGQPETFNATVTSENNTPVSGVNVKFHFDGADYLILTDTNGVASFEPGRDSPTVLSVGSDTVTASYDGKSTSGQMIFTPPSPMTVSATVVV